MDEAADKATDKAIDAISYQVQRTRTLQRVWNNHAWPKADAVCREFKMVTLNLDMVKGAAQTILWKGVERHSKPPRYWVLPKDKPHRLVMASAREQQVVYHKEIVEEDDEEEYGDKNDENVYANDEAVDLLEDALDGLTLV